MEKEKSIEQSTINESLQSFTTEDNGRIRGVFIFAPDFPAFEGHFPGQPVLPAVVQLAAVRFLASKHLGKNLLPVTIDRSKYKTMIGPQEEVAITLDLDQHNDDISISFSVTTDKGKAATGVITCRITHD